MFFPIQNYVVTKQNSTFHPRKTSFVPPLVRTCFCTCVIQSPWDEVHNGYLPPPAQHCGLMKHSGAEGCYHFYADSETNELSVSPNLWWLQMSGAVEPTEWCTALVTDWQIEISWGSSSNCADTNMSLSLSIVEIYTYYIAIVAVEFSPTSFSCSWHPVNFRSTHWHPLFHYINK